MNYDAEQELFEQLDSITLLSLALWQNPQKSEQVAVETVTALMTLDLTADSFVDRLGKIFLNRLKQEGDEASSGGAYVEDPFYRLTGQERLVLIALHRCRWSYERLCRVLEISADTLQEIAWGARLELLYSPGSAQRLAAARGAMAAAVSKGLVHPTGNPVLSSECPAYHPARPWTQKFLDSQYSAKERLFLQMHLERCVACRDTLSRARVAYYAVDHLIPFGGARESRMYFESLERVLRKMVYWKHPVQRSAAELFWFFFRRWETWLVLLGAMIAIVLATRG